jgi:hypothetical protein
MSPPTPSDWVFAEPKNVMTISSRTILHKGQPILLVSRDVADGSWMFLDGGPFSMEDGMLVTLKTIVEHDPSVCELADLPIGWSARRERAGGPWKRSRDEE